MKRIALLGSTGSIGRQTLDVVRWHPECFQVVALIARRLSELFLEQVREFRPRVACLTADGNLGDFDVPGSRVLHGAEHLRSIVHEPDVDLLVVASSGTVGLGPTLAALEVGKPVALANKETLIMAGHLVTRAAAQTGALLLPIDSEHSAIWQCLEGEQRYDRRVRRLILTASGGAFRDLPVEALSSVTPQQALQHPTWRMGPKITVDSATLMNKGLEIIEAHWLFGLPLERMDVVIHHQSVIHSLVEFVDGSVKAQLGLPDMRLPIQYALGYPERLPAPVPPVHLPTVGQLTFAEVDTRKYPCLALANWAGEQGGTYPTVLNAANEVAVERFLAGELQFDGLARLIEHVLEAHEGAKEPGLEEVLAADQWGRRYARAQAAG